MSAIKVFKAITPSLRHRVGIDYRALSVKKVKIPRKLEVKGKKVSGRSSSTGTITVRRRGGGAKKAYKVVDFYGKEERVPGVVKCLLYDPNRNVHLALVNYVDGDKRLVIATKNMKSGFKIDFDKDMITEGSRMKLKDIPVGLEVCNVEIRPGSGGKIARAAGTSVFLAGFDKGYAQLKLPSGELRLVDDDCKATIGKVGNEDFKNIRLGKAGRSRLMGIRPHVRGKVMNAKDHPHGGGKGRNPIGMSQRKTPKGKPTQGVKTRKLKNPTSKFIIKSRLGNKVRGR